MKIDQFTVQSGTIAIALTVTASTPVTLPGVGQSLRIVNSGTAPIFVAIASSPLTATIPGSSPSGSSMAVGAGATVVFSLAPIIMYISAIASVGTATIYVSVGEGS